MSRLDQLSKLHAADPDDADVCYMIAQEHANAGDHAEAIAWYDRCLERDASYHYAYFHQARSHEASGDVEHAKHVLGAGLERATADRNDKALSEIAGYLDQLNAGS